MFGASGGAAHHTKCQGSDTWARTQNNPVVFMGKPTFKNREKNPAQNKQILMSYSTVIKKFFTTLKDVNI